MKTNEGYGVCFNVQTAVDSKHYLIAGFEVTSNPTDHGLLEGVAAAVKEDFGLETIEAAADKGCRGGEGLLNCLFNVTIPNVPPAKGKTEIELEAIHEAAEITDEMKNSKKADDIKTCIQSGVIPEIYKGVISEIEVVKQTYYESPDEEADDGAAANPMSEEEMTAKAKEGNFVRDINKGRVYCPEGKTLRQKSEKKDGSIRYYNKLACGGCAGKCTKSEHKEVDFPAGRIIIECRGIEKPEPDAEAKARKKPKRIKKTREVVRLKFKPDRKKLDNRKCMSEHPFGTIKRALNGYYFLLKGREKTSGEMSLLCMAYNIKRAINIQGVKAIMDVLSGKAA
jgi:transposase